MQDRSGRAALIQERVRSLSLSLLRSIGLTSKMSGIGADAFAKKPTCEDSDLIRDRLGTGNGNFRISWSRMRLSPRLAANMAVTCQKVVDGQHFAKQAMLAHPVSKASPFKTPNQRGASMLHRFSVVVGRLDSAPPPAQV